MVHSHRLFPHLSNTFAPCESILHLDSHRNNRQSARKRWLLVVYNVQLRTTEKRMSLEVVTTFLI